uniref:Type I-A CRISPR-associated protein Cas4/Csa1 n=1 Tax=Thermofilum adornatum TaxID=1365176 RepID=A0A7C1CG68_9CREN
MPGLFWILEDVLALYKDLRRLPEVEVSEELRGWSFSSGVVSSSSGSLLGVSDITGGFCEKGRDVYLRYVKKVKPRDNAVLQRGRLIHEVWTRTVALAKKKLYEGGLELTSETFQKEMTNMGERLLREMSAKYNLLNLEEVEWLTRRIFGEGIATYASALERQFSRSRYLEIDGLVSSVVPFITEFTISGERVGLSRSLRVDAYIPPSLLLELKTRPPRREFELSLAGYALAFESVYEVPVNRGLLVYVEADNVKRRLYIKPRLIDIGDGLRTEFIDKRDKLKEYLTYQLDPGKSSSCPRECPYIYYCNGGKT